MPLVVMTVAGVLTYAALDPVQRERLLAKPGELLGSQHRSVVQREAMMRLAWRMFIDHPWSGVGPGLYELARLPYEHEIFSQPRFQPVTGLSPWVHNDPLQVAAEMGLIGLLPYCWIVLVAVWLPWHLLRFPEGREHLARTLGWWCGSLGVFIHGLTHFSLDAPAAALLGWLGLAITGIDPRSKQPTKAACCPLAQRAAMSLGCLVATGILSLKLTALLVQDQALYAMLGARDAIERIEARVDRLAEGYRQLERMQNPQQRAALEQQLALHRAEVEQDGREFTLQLDDAHASYQWVASRRPYSRTLWWQIGQLHRLHQRAGTAQQQAHARAIAAYERGLALAPNDFQLHQALAELRLERGELDQARHHATAALANRPNAPLAHCHLGIIALQRRLYDEAHAHFQRARAADERNPQGYLWAAVAHIQQSHPERALDVLMQGVERVEDTVLQRDLAMMMVLIRLSIGQPNHAERLMRLVLQRTGIYHDQSTMGMLIERQRQQQEAELLPLMLVEHVNHLARRIGELDDKATINRAMVHHAQFTRAIDASLGAHLAGNAASGEAQAVSACEALRILGLELEACWRETERHRLAHALNDQGASQRLVIAAQRLVEELAVLRTAILGDTASGKLGGPLVGKPEQRAWDWRMVLIDRLERCAELPRSERYRRGLHGPRYRMELALIARHLHADDLAHAEARHFQQVLGDDIALLIAEALLSEAAAQPTQEEREALLSTVEQELTQLTQQAGLVRTLLPPWAVEDYQQGSAAARRIIHSRLPDTALVAQLRLAELELLRGSLASAATRCEHIVAICHAGGAELDSRKWLQVEETSSLTAASITTINDHAIDRLALQLAIVLRLKLGHRAAARSLAVKLSSYSDAGDSEKILATLVDTEFALLARIDRS
jgi:tetratricopeptide (TPR) repeat protein